MQTKRVRAKSKSRLTKPKLIVFGLEDIRRWGPCYDPSKYAAEGTRGTVLDVLRHKKLSAPDKLWLVCREELLDAGLLRRFAVAQAKTVRKHIKAGNKKEFDRVLRVCLRFSEGKATQDELSAARSAAESAAWSAARSAAWSAAVRMLNKMVRAEYSTKREE